MSGAFDQQAEGATGSGALSNIEAELSLLGDLIDNNRLIDEVADRLRPVDFSVPIYGRVYARMLEQSASGGPVDAVTLAPFFSEDENWPRTYSTLAAASLNAGPRARTKAYFDQIIALSSRRRLVAGLTDVAVAASNMQIGTGELLANADEAIAGLADQIPAQQAPVHEYAQAVIDSFGKPITGVRCGLIGSLDDAMGVLRPTNMAVVGGRPGQGKTSLVTSYSIGAALRGHGVLIFSLEMSADELTRRMLADMCCTPTTRVLYEQVRDGTVRGSALDLVRDAKRRFDALPLEINETAGLTIAKLIRQARTHKRRLAAKGQALELVVVDYLQLMAHSRKGMSAYEHASEVSRALKEFAKAEKLVVMAVAQLNRDLERRPDRRPLPSDLRDSGQIEQDADLILFVHREEEYLKASEPDDPDSPAYRDWLVDMEAVRNKVEFLVRKRRSGPTGKAMGWFFGANAAVRGSDFYQQPNDTPGGAQR